MARKEHFEAGSTEQQPEQLSLFDTAPFTKPEPQMDYEPEAWLARQDISWHASEAQNMPTEGGGLFGEGFHHGTLPAAMQRGRITSPSSIKAEDYLSPNSRGFIHPVRVTGEVALREEPSKETFSQRTDPIVPQAHKAHPLVFSDSEANRSDEVPRIIAAGQSVPYVNAVEGIGSISMRSPRENLRTWAEDVAADPGAAREHKLLAEQFDLTVPAKENWARERLGRKTGPHARNLPESLSGEVTENTNLFGETEVSGQSELVVNQPRFKKKTAAKEHKLAAKMGEWEPA